VSAGTYLLVISTPRFDPALQRDAIAPAGLKR
jgi:hypothetical protein